METLSVTFSTPLFGQRKQNEIEKITKIMLTNKWTTFGEITFAVHTAANVLRIQMFNTIEFIAK